MRIVADVNDASSPAATAKRYSSISRIYAIVAVVMLAVSVWTATHLSRGERSVSLSLALNLVLGLVMAGCAVYFRVAAKKAERAGVA